MWEKGIGFYDWDTYIKIGKAYKDQGNLPKAIQMWEKGIELRPISKVCPTFCVPLLGIFDIYLNKYETKMPHRLMRHF